MNPSCMLLVGWDKVLVRLVYIQAESLVDKTPQLVFFVLDQYKLLQKYRTFYEMKNIFYTHNGLTFWNNQH